MPITQLSDSQLIEKGALLNGAKLLAQANYTLDLVAQDPSVLDTLEDGFLDDARGLRDRLKADLGNQAVATEDSKQATQDQNKAMRNVKIWARKVSKRIRQLALQGIEVPDELFNASMSERQADFGRDALRKIALLESIQATGKIRTRLDAFLQEGRELVSHLQASSTEQDLKLTGLPPQTQQRYRRQGELLVALKMINNAGGEVYADAPPMAARYNMALLYKSNPDRPDQPEA